MKDEMVESAQNWLNETYGMNLKVTGHTGTIVMEALVTALQIDLGMASPTGYFGDTTAILYEAHQISLGSYDTTTLHLVKILQYGLYCKGYNAGSVSGTFDETTLAAVKKVQSDAGLTSNQISQIVTSRVFKAILSSDALVLINGGDKVIRGIQQALNRKYIDYIGIMPCDGMYGAGLAKSLIYALQAEGKLDISTANGNFGSLTQTIATNHPQSISNYEENFVLIAKYALYCNGVRRNTSNQFDTSINGTFTGVFDTAMATAITAFQNFTAIMEVTGSIGIKEWMSLLVSTGYPKRNVLACDSSTQITDVKAKRIVANDFEIIGRYLTGSTSKGPKNLTRNELNILFNNNLRVFAIYQDEKAYYAANPDEYTTKNYYDYEQGYSDAENACNAAIALGIPYGEYIFFSVDYDFTNDEVSTKIIPHFKGINEYIREHGNKYKVGIYGPRNVCTRVSNVSFAQLSFVSDMSTGYSGNLGYRLPENWAFDQIREYTQGAADGSFNLDCVAASGRYLGFNSIVEESVTQEGVSSDILALEFYKKVINIIGLNIDVAFEQNYKIPFGTFTIEFEGEIGADVTIGSDNAVLQLDVTNGKITEPAWVVSEPTMAALATALSVGVIDGNLEIISQLNWQIESGRIVLGLGLTSDNKLEVYYIIHKSIAEEEGLENYVEIGIKITTNSELTAGELAMYYNYLVCIENSRVISELAEVPWDKVQEIILAIFLFVLFWEEEGVSEIIKAVTTCLTNFAYGILD